MANAKDETPRSEIVAALPWVLGAVATMAVLSLVWWAMLDPGKDAGLKQIIVPEGTAAKIAAGEPTFAIPSNIVIARAGELSVVNQDVVAHTIAGRVVQPGETVDIVASDSEGEFVCSFHPGGSLGFTVSGRGSLIVTVAIPAFILGLPIGIGIALAVAVGRRIGFGDESYA